MAVPGQDSRDFPVRLTKQGGEAIDQEASRLGVEKAEVFRIALTEYFKRQGRIVEFSPRRGGKRTKMLEYQTVERVARRVQALGLPEPAIEFSVSRKTYDLAWPDKKVAIDISRQKRPADTNNWSVWQIQPTMTDDQIDEVLRSLPL